MRFIVLVLVLVVGGLVAAPCVAGETTVRSYGVAGVGTLELDVPMRWKESVGWTEGDHRPSLTFRPDEGEAFALTISVLPPPADAPPEFATLAWLRALVETSARASLGVPDDQDLALEEIGEGRAVGWYYSVADRSLPEPPPPGTWRVMTQGASAAGPVVLTATLLTQRQWGEEVGDGLDLLRTARLTQAQPDARRVPGAAVQDRAGLGQRYDLVLPEGFDLEASAPLRARDRATGALLAIDVRPTDGRSSVRDELRRLEQALERRSPGAWIARRRGPALLAGAPAARLVAVDELRDEAVTSWALPLADAVLTLTWRVNPTRARDAGPRLDAVLAGLTLRP